VIHITNHALERFEERGGSGGKGKLVAMWKHGAKASNSVWRKKGHYRIATDFDSGLKFVLTGLVLSDHSVLVTSVINYQIDGRRNHFFRPLENPFLG
jgi:hypothetical protein